VEGKGSLHPNENKKHTMTSQNITTALLLPAETWTLGRDPVASGTKTLAPDPLSPVELKVLIHLKDGAVVC